MSIHRQSVSNLRSSTMRKRRFRRVSDMFKLMTALTRRERKRKKKFRFPNTIGNGKREKRATKRRWKKIESKKVLCLKDLPFATDLTSSITRRRMMRSRLDMPRERHTLPVSIQKIRSQKISTASETSTNRFDLRFQKKEVCTFFVNKDRI